MIVTAAVPHFGAGSFMINAIGFYNSSCLAVYPDPFYAGLLVWFRDYFFFWLIS